MCTISSRHSTYDRRLHEINVLLTLWSISSTVVLIYLLYFILFLKAEFPTSAFSLKLRCVPGALHAPPSAPILLLFVLSLARCGPCQSPDLWRELARRAHAAEWLERFQRFGRLQQGSPVPVLQPATRRYDTGEAVHSGETDATSTQSHGGILGRG